MEGFVQIEKGRTSEFKELFLGFLMDTGTSDETLGAICDYIDHFDKEDEADYEGHLIGCLRKDYTRMKWGESIKKIQSK